MAQPAHAAPNPVPEPTDEDLALLLSTLSLEQKVRLLTGSAPFSLAAEGAIGLDRIDVSDGPTGVRGLKFLDGPHVVLFPNATVLASAWSDDVIAEAAGIVADEAERQHISVVLGPTINLHRSPLGGRLFEQYSEDPYLTGRLAAGYVRALQARRIGACLKHFAANESETARTEVNAVVDAATLRELYLMPFEIAVEDAQPWTIMAAYNDVNGTPATENEDLLHGVLRDEWVWDGVVMSDWFATKHTAEAANGGLDLVMPGPDGPWGPALVAAVERREVREYTIDDHLARVLRLAARTQNLVERRSWREDLPAPDSGERAEQLTRLAAAGFVVLKNETSDGIDAAGNAVRTLPVPINYRIAAIGRAISDTTVMGGGSASVNAPYQRSVAEGLAGVFSEVDVVDGVDVRSRPLPARRGDLLDPTTGEPGMRVIYRDGDGDVLADRHVPSAEVLIGFDDDFPRPVAEVELSGRLAHGGPVEFGLIGSGAWTFTTGHVEREFSLTLEGADPGAGMFTPPYWMDTAEFSDGDLFVAHGHLGADEPFGQKALIAHAAPRPVDDIIADAVRAATAADVAVVAVGLTEESETEGSDKTTLSLPGEQNRMVHEVAAAAKRTVVLVNAATPVLMPWEDEVEAILVIGLPGQEGGVAVARALAGELEPAGRLVTTWPNADGGSPAWNVTPDENMDLRYAEGRFMGYRGHAPYGLSPAPAHWFGEGLGYGAVEYGPCSVEVRDGVPVLAVSLHNSAQRATREVVQMYLRPDDPALPVRLIGFQGVDLPSESDAEVEVQADPRMLRRWTDDGWEALSPAGEVLVARGLGDVRATVPLR